MLYEILKSSVYREYVKEVASGTSVLMLKKADFVKFSFLIPPQNILIQFENIIPWINKKLDINYSSIKLLENLRDTLLPKLMSGEVRVMN